MTEQLIATSRNILYRLIAVTLDFLRAFVTHPASVGESYLGHFAFACKFAMRLFVAGGAALIHAFIPPLFETTASHQIHQLHDELMQRATAGKDDDA